MPIRPFKPKDKLAIVSIYNQAVETGFSTAETEPVTVASRSLWFDEHQNPLHPILVDEADSGSIRGWCSLSPYRKGRQALKHTVEISYYVERSCYRQGVATRLVESMTHRAIEYRHKTLFAIVLETNQPSIHLLRKLNFSQWAYLPAVADFDGRECAHLYFGKRIQ